MRRSIAAKKERAHDLKSSRFSVRADSIGFAPTAGRRLSQRFSVRVPAGVDLATLELDEAPFIPSIASDAELAQHYRPIITFHPDEAYFPCSMEDYLANAELWFDAPPSIAATVSDAARTMGPEYQVMQMPAKKAVAGVAAVRLNPLGTLTSSALRQGFPGFVDEAFSAHYRLRMAPEFWKGSDIKGLASVPLYARVRRHETELPPELRTGSVENDSAPFLSILYIALYPYNGAHKICSCCSVGSHEGDVEHLSVYVALSTGRVLGAYFASHRMRDGEWLQGDALSYHDAEKQRIVAFVAKHGHGFYPKGKRIWRVCGCGNDLCGPGWLWDPDQVHVITPDSDLGSFRGKLGTLLDKGGPRGVVGAPVSQEWWDSEWPVSRTAFKRLCCHCLS